MSPAWGLLLSFVVVPFLGARLWTDIDGRQMEAEFLKLEDGIVHVRLLRDGREYTVPLERFVEADRAYLAEVVSMESGFERAPFPVELEHLKSVERYLIDGDGRRWRDEALVEHDFTLFYYSAHWCGPCQRFTPQLVEFYQTHKKGRNFEIIFVSSDYGEDSMETYMEKAQMPWPAVEFDRIDRAEVKRYAGRGIPCLVLFDRQGTLIAHSYEGENYLGPSHVLRELEQRLKTL